MKKNSLIIVFLLSILSCSITGNEFNTEFIYKIENRSGYDVIIKSFSSSGILSRNIKIPVNNIFKESIFDNATDNSLIVKRILKGDSATVIFKDKFIGFKCTFNKIPGSSSECTEIGSPYRTIRENNSFTYTITQQDYENAEDCNGNCE